MKNSLRIACIGGGPGGLYFAISMKLRNPNAQVTVFERNKSNDTFGWGVVLSDQTLAILHENDAVTAKEIHKNFAYWDDLSVVVGDKRVTSSGHGFCGIGRMRLLLLLQKRAVELGVEQKFCTEISEEDIQQLSKDYDVVVASDGLNSKTRTLYQEHFAPMIDTRACKFVWLGTKQKFNDAFTFIFEKTDKGWLWAHAYQFQEDMATFIIECDEATWQAHGFGELSQQESITLCEDIFKDHLDGQALVSNANHIRGSAWLNFPRILCEKWSYENLVLLGDASATAHFSIGSGTKLALESAISLADFISTSPTLEKAFARYESERRLEVLRIQSAALNSMEWFENIHLYLDFDLAQFTYSLLTRSQRISHEGLRLRDKNWLESVENWFQKQSGAKASSLARTPMFSPLALRDMQLDNRIVVAPIMQYRAKEGQANNWHFVHYAERAKGGAGLICTETLAVTQQGRMTLGCAGLYDDGQQVLWQSIVDFTHQETGAKICAQLGHAGARGSIQLPWQNENIPLEDGWDLVSASSVAWSKQSALPKELDTHQMRAIIRAFQMSAQRALSCGFDMLELHAAQGTLLASFLSPATNKRSDEYGGDIENRCAFPIEVFKGVREVWPQERPISVRISAHDWLDNKGTQLEDAVHIAQVFKEAGVDMIVVSSGGTLASSKPRYGRLYQTPFSDRIRNEVGIKTMAVGNISEADQVNSILLAGRADLVAIGKPHLAQPYWTNMQVGQMGGVQQDDSKAYPYAYDKEQFMRQSHVGGS